MTASPLMRPKEISPDPLVLAQYITSMTDGISCYLHETVKHYGHIPARSFHRDSFKTLLLLHGRLGAPYVSDVLACPGGGWKAGHGYWTKDLPIPYVTNNGMSLTPAHGCEQISPSTLWQAPPCIGSSKKSLRIKRVWSCFWENWLIVLFPRGLLVRRFQFLIDTIFVNDFQLGLGKTFTRFLFDGVQKRNNSRFSIREGAQLDFSNPMAVENSTEYYWDGPLQPLMARNPSLRSKVLLRLAKQP